MPVNVTMPAGIIRQIDFQETVLSGMLALLLFAGALHVDLSTLRDRAWTVGSMATIGTVISTMIVGVGFWLAADTLGVRIRATEDGVSGSKRR